MKSQDFGAFYEAIHGYPPFPWQMALAEQACGGDWPDTLSLPTSSGKTSAIDVAVFSLALQADRADRTARLRIAFVVDRRIVVDEAFEHAKRIRDALDAPTSSIVQQVADRLKTFSGGASPLHVVQMRGGMHRDESWAKSPCQPTVIVSTVDQVGSRLLFRGYGLPKRSRSIHAGLLGMDTRIVLDEAHLSAPFEDTIAYVARAQRVAPRAVRLPPGLVLTRMTATPRGTDSSLRLGAEDRANRVLGARLGASKPAHARVSADLVKDAVEQALAWQREGHVVGVVVNRVASARAVFERVRHALGDTDRCALIIGRSRPADRDEMIARWKDRIFAKPGRPSTGLVVVATQTVEVGANLDFDRLVTELAPLDALRQRFGRLNRLANHATACPALLLAARDTVLGRDAGKDPVYGDRLPKVWSWISEQGSPTGKEPWIIDFGIDALDAMIDASVATSTPAEVEQPAARQQLLASLSSATPACPVVLPTHLDAWVQTFPAPVPDPPVGPYLHGPQALDAADVQIVWRADLDGEDSVSWAGIVAPVPPKMGEALAVPRAAAIKWLADLGDEPVADILSTPTEGYAGRLADDAGRQVLRWGGPDEAEVVAPHAIRPGDTLVVPAAYGGVDKWGWSPHSREGVGDIDIAEPLLDGVRRLNPALVPPDKRAEVEARYAALADEVSSDARETILEALFELFGLQQPENYQVRPYGGPRPYLIAAPKRVRRGEFADDNDSSMSTRQVSLAEHSGDVERVATSFTQPSCLPSRDLAAVVTRAAWFHDVGKADPRMQAWLGEGVVDASRPLAKSSMDWRDRRRNLMARVAAGYPDGGRHELASVVMLRASTAALASVEHPDLLLHLVGTHHGHGRGLPPVVLDEAPVAFTLQHGDLQLHAEQGESVSSLDDDWGDRFWRVQREYGPWGLAWLEAVIRLADHRASEEESKTSGGAA